MVWGIHGRLGKRRGGFKKLFLEPKKNMIK